MDERQMPAGREPDPLPRLLIISHDVVGERMAGPGIRYYHLARVLGKYVPATLAERVAGAGAPSTGATQRGG